MIKGIVLIIPAYNPDEKFIAFLQSLASDGWNDIIVVDDGSKLETQKYFNLAETQYGCEIVRHYVNLGQGRAFKSAFNYCVGKYGDNPDFIGVVECDCDGQHVLDDVNRCAELLHANPDKFILGVRNFKDKDIPFRSRFGNRCTNFVFKVFCGLDIEDTQTGLKGIPKAFIYKLIEAKGERFEYASSVLLEAKNNNVEILQFPIQTIYIDGNATSHFNPLVDSLRIYSLIFRYLLSSLSTVVIDFVVFAIFIKILSQYNNTVYLASTVAKLFSATFNFYINKRKVFCSKGNIACEAVKYVLLCFGHILASATLINLLVKYTAIASVPAKMIVDTVLFMAVYYIQNVWVFKNGKKG